MEKYEETYLDLLKDGVADLQDRFVEFRAILEKDKYFATYKAYAKINSRTVELNNTAITYNNKVVELYQLYKSKNMDFCDSDVIPIVLDYFSALLNEVEFYLKLLDNLIKDFKKFSRTLKALSRKQTAAHIVAIEEMLIKCEAVDKKLFDFSIERDFVGILDVEKEYIDAREEYGDPEHKHPGAVLHNCNIELGLLGYSKETGERYQYLTIEKEHVYTQKLWELIALKKEEFKNRYAKFPYVQWALNNLLDSAEDVLADAFDSGSLEEIGEVFENVRNLVVADEIVDALGTIISYYKLDFDLEAIKQELFGIGLASKYDELIENLKSGIYDESALEGDSEPRKSFKIES